MCLTDGCAWLTGVRVQIEYVVGDDPTVHYGTVVFQPLQSLDYVRNEEDPWMESFTNTDPNKCVTCLMWLLDGMISPSVLPLGAWCQVVLS